ncbi:InlB B-repeat-containing protein, partial [Thermocrinis sp.]|uniref:InlB B-repeat-containing protein n=1 Tax=Thermocrinis sp. TaxID=2024383 RepID=UPI003C0210E0
EKDGKKLPVEVSYKLIGKNRYSFVVAKADPSLPLVIDPILQSTYLGGNNSDWARALAIHPTTGEVYVAGNTTSTDFPNTSGGAQKSRSGGSDVFVARLNKELTQILQATYLGGSNDDEAYALAIHPTTGEVYVAGHTKSFNFPNTIGGAQENIGGNANGFVARLNPELTRILQATYLGGSGGDIASALTIHPITGEVYIAGLTTSTNFPNTAGGAQTTYGGGGDAFVARLSRDLTKILQSTYLGEVGSDIAFALAIHPITGEVYVAGLTGSRNFPGTAGGAQSSEGGNGDAFVARLNSNLTKILQSTYLGGRDNDFALDLVIHPTTGDVYLAGFTNSTDFPNTTGGAQANKRGIVNGFVARLNRDLTRILQATYLGGGDYDWVRVLAIHPATGDVYVAGFTLSINFPNTTGGAQARNNGGIDAFITRLNSDLTQILQSTYLGGNGEDKAFALAIHPRTGEVYVAGQTFSINFPNTIGGAQRSIGGDGDAFVAKLTINLTSGNILSISPTPKNGNVKSRPTGIDCGSGNSLCSADFYGAITLTATPAAGHTFVGWGGDCSACGKNPTCEIDMNKSKTCSANFTPSKR